MAAQRLLIAMVVLLVISTVVAALAPQPVDRDESEEESAEAPAVLDEPGWRKGSGDGRVLERRLRVGAGGPRGLRARPGDRLILEVAAREGQEISIPDLGLIDYADPAAPARFDLFLDDPARIAVRAELEPDPIAVIEVRATPQNPESRTAEPRSEPLSALPRVGALLALCMQCPLSTSEMSPPSSTSVSGAKRPRLGGRSAPRPSSCCEAASPPVPVSRWTGYFRVPTGSGRGTPFPKAPPRLPS